MSLYNKGPKLYTCNSVLYESSRKAGAPGRHRPLISASDLRPPVKLRRPAWCHWRSRGDVL